jgi:hypothetical protein
MARSTLPRHKKFAVGTRVQHHETKERGVVVHVFSDRTLADVVVVTWAGSDHGTAVPIETLRPYKIAERRRRRR